MKIASGVVAAVLLVAPTALAQAPAPTRTGLSAGILQNYENIKRNLVESANKMPEADYGFKPTPDIRSYGQLFGHVANSQFGACAAAKGEPNPNQGTNNEQKTTKAEFVKALSDSFAYCDPVYKSLTDATAVEFVKRGQNEVARGAVLAQNNAHNDEMYGISTVYLRLKGLVPPSTEAEEQRRQQQRR